MPLSKGYIMFHKSCILILIVLLSACMISACSGEKSRQIPQMNFQEFETLLHQQNDTVYVINFWATWCKPCIEELPAFEQLNTEYEDQKVSVILVSLDFPNKYEQLLLPFVKEKNLQSQIIHLTDVDANAWIDKVSPEWSGAIPATLIYKGNDRGFYESQMNFEKLKSIVKTKL